MAIFDAYDEEFTQLSSSVDQELLTLKGCTDEEGDSSSVIRQLSALMSQSHDLIKQMEIEVRSQEGLDRKRLQEKVTEYKRALKTKQGQFSAEKTRVSKTSLMRGANVNGSDLGKSAEQRQRLLDTNDKLFRQNETILNAQRTVAETEEVGIEITDELARNRERIQASRDRVSEFTGISDSARRMIGSMQRREVQTKFVMGFVFFIVLVCIILTIYYANKRK